MLGKIIDVLLSLTLKWADKAPYKVQMKPVSIFLKHQMEILKENLYPVSLSAVVCNIWERIIKVTVNPAISHRIVFFFFSGLLLVFFNRFLCSILCRFSAFCTFISYFRYPIIFLDSFQHLTDMNRGSFLYTSKFYIQTKLIISSSYFIDASFICG